MTNGIDAGFCNEEKDDVKDEGSESNDCSKTGDAGATTRHGHFANMSKKTKDRRDDGKCEADDMKEESIG